MWYANPMTDDLKKVKSTYFHAIMAHYNKQYSLGDANSIKLTARLRQQCSHAHVMM